MFIAVIGGSRCTPEEDALAEAVGQELARRGVILVTGGLSGVMEAASRGAAQAGGMTVGILPGDHPGEANPFVKIPIATGIGFARNCIVVKSAQAVIAVGGEFGTLSEIGHALQFGIPVVGLNTWSLSKGGKLNSSMMHADDPVEAVEKAVAAAQRAFPQ